MDETMVERDRKRERASVLIGSCSFSIASVIGLRMSFDAHSWVGVLSCAAAWAVVSTIGAHLNAALSQPQAPKDEG